MVKIPPFHPVGFAAEILNQKGINRLRFGGAEELLGQGAALIDTTGQERLGGARFLLVAQATRAQHTFEAVIAKLPDWARRAGRHAQPIAPG